MIAHKVSKIEVALFLVCDTILSRKLHDKHYQTKIRKEENNLVITMIMITFFCQEGGGKGGPNITLLCSKSVTVLLSPSTHLSSDISRLQIFWKIRFR